jgi:hypothetical protein
MATNIKRNHQLKVLSLLDEAAGRLSEAQMLLAQAGDSRAEDLQKFRRRLNTQSRRFQAYPVGSPNYRYDPPD